MPHTNNSTSTVPGNQPQPVNYNYCTINFLDGRVATATVKKVGNCFEPDKIQIGDQWFDFEEYEASDDDNANYRIVNYREKAPLPTAEAQFYVQLICSCPSCGEQINLYDIAAAADLPCPCNTDDTHINVECPTCTIPFIVYRINY